MGLKAMFTPLRMVNMAAKSRWANQSTSHSVDLSESHAEPCSRAGVKGFRFRRAWVAPTAGLRSPTRFLERAAFESDALGI